MEPKQLYTLDNFPGLTEESYVIEQFFLRHLNHDLTPYMEELKPYLQRLNKYDWNCLLACNPHKEFLQYISNDMVKKLDWRYILSKILDDR